MGDAELRLLLGTSRPACAVDRERSRWVKRSSMIVVDDHVSSVRIHWAIVEGAEEQACPSRPAPRSRRAPAVFAAIRHLWMTCSLAVCSLPAPDGLNS